MNLVEKLLQERMEKAKFGGYTSIAITCTGHNGDWEHYYSGMQDKAQLVVMGDLLKRLEAAIIDDELPVPTNYGLDASFAGYHVGTGPSNFDFLNWIMLKEMRRIDFGTKGPLKIAFYMGKTPKPNKWIDAVFRPIMRMIGAVEDDRALERMGEDFYLTKPIVDMYELGCPLPPLKAVNDYPELPKGVVTITLREADHWPHRNSDFDAWMKFADHLAQLGERVVFLRDTCKADWALNAHETCPYASRNLDARMWLYQHAKLNCFVSNGPMMLAVMSNSIPYLAFVPPEDEGTEYYSNHPTFWRNKMGVTVGNQYPWRTKQQLIMWQKDTHENIMSAFELLRDAIS